jgi:murein DD-endopeptidase MepM/ murein hydrolase activator NlpD
VNSGFGNREDPVSGRQRFHQGIDMRAPREERVLAAGRGEVVFSGRQSGYGNVVMLDHGNRLITLYAHLSRSIVKLEQVVERGQTIGYVGSSGKATGTHLHFEVRHKGVPVDPLKYLP